MREYEYTGPMWYQREVDIPSKWVGKSIELYLERVHMSSQLWVNDKHLSNLRVGSESSNQTIWVDGSVNQKNGSSSGGKLRVVINVWSLYCGAPRTAGWLERRYRGSRA